MVGPKEKSSAENCIAPRQTGQSSIVVVIPALNEEASIGDVVRGISRDLVSRIIVADGGSRDATVVRAPSAGADGLAAGRGSGRVGCDARV